MQNPLKDLLEYFEDTRVMLLYPMCAADVRDILEETKGEEEDEEYKYKD
jgi:predicted glycosyltransferase